MKRAIATSFIAAAIAIALPHGAPAQTAPEPSASPAAQLPEIGRVRATSAACAAMRDVVIPAFAAARRADAQFGTVREDLPRYIQLKADYKSQRTYTVKSGGMTLEAQWHKVSSESASLLHETEAIRKLLDDPRLPAQSTDPAIRVERERLAALYAAQQARASYLNELMQRESVSLAKSAVGTEDPLAFPQGQHVPIEPQARPRTASTAPPGMPLLNGFDAADRARIEEWSAAQVRAVHDTEEQAAKTFLPFAQACR